MSQVVDFYVVPDSSIAAIQKAAVPQKTRWYRAPEDTFWQTLWGSAGQGELNFDWGGYAFVVLIEYLRERGDFDVDACETSELASFLTKARESYFLTFTVAQAEKWAQKLRTIAPDDENVTKFVTGFSHEDERDTMIQAVRSAITVFPPALNAVRPGTIGLLHVG
ncbi:MAG: hypothetical protein JO165_00805 [Candidatus Eremiobacteraeota bacterium]|nr:hypothetical protein [Candidatus Eremiobacteraeota bacterium]